jgi:hypothetical protein
VTRASSAWARETTLVGFSTSNALVSRLIRYFTKAKVSHTFLVIRSPMLEEDLVIEAGWGGFQATTLRRFKKKNEIVALLKPIVPLDKGLRDSLAWLGESYDFGGLFGMAFVLLGRWLRRKYANPLHDSRALFCSEANTLVLQASGYPGADGLAPTETSPEDLFLFMKGAETSVTDVWGGRSERKA